MKSKTCSYCNEIGHSINNCKHQSIDILQQKIKTDCVIHLYCITSFDFNFLLHKLKLLSIPELRVLYYKNNFSCKLSNKPSKLELEQYIHSLITYYSFTNKDYIYIPYCDNNHIWKYANEIYNLTKLKTPLYIYKDIIKISPRPRLYNINCNLICNQIIPFKNDDNNCSICFDLILKNGMCTLNCNHSFCANCINNYLFVSYKNRKNVNCPLCRKDILSININDYYSYIYINTTFCQSFIPNYFNQLPNSSIDKRHIYEKRFYYQNNTNVEDSDEDLSPYNYRFEIYLPRNRYNLPSPESTYIIHEMRNIDIFLVRRIFITIQRWFLFISIILILNQIKEYNESSNDVTHFLQLDYS